MADHTENKFPSKEAAERLNKAIQTVKVWLDLKIRTGRYSFGLVCELAENYINRGYDVYAIYHEIGCLEGSEISSGGTKPAAAFQREPLLGLWHKHHHQTTFVIRNLRQELNTRMWLQASLHRFWDRLLTEILLASLYTRQSSAILSVVPASLG